MKLHWDNTRETITLHPETINERGRCEILMRCGWHVGFGREPNGELLHVTFAIMSPKRENGDTSTQPVAEGDTL